MRRRQFVCESQILLEKLKTAANNRLAAHLAETLLPIRSFQDLRMKHAVLFGNADRFRTVQAFNDHSAVAMLHLTQKLPHAAHRANPENAVLTGRFVFDIFLHAQENQMIARSCRIGRTYRRIALHIEGQRHLREYQQAAHRNHRQFCKVCHICSFFHCFLSILQSRGLPQRPVPASFSFVSPQDPAFGKSAACRLPERCRH